MICLIIYIVIGQAYGYYVHCKYPHKTETHEEKFTLVLIEHIIIPLFFPVFIILELYKTYNNE